jgi:N-ethylmaleimide reductase
LQAYDDNEVHSTYAYLTTVMEELGVQYIHISANPAIPQKTFEAIRSSFSNTIILCNGITPQTEKPP